MLKKMLIQGVAAAVLVGAAAAVYAQVQDNGYLSTPTQTQTKASDKAMPDGGKHAGEDRDGRKHADRGEAHAKAQKHDRDDD
ncbi:hypothetical protein SAMN02745126_01888 [Enhydrobacter aerosaccus]|uniref:Uncharacterized protein n=1 Tax=Enhydrobacter aerosaccus TaxID=225324 RepID=A0A1T4MNG6_9HYPH|nr:hypothetical protein [Enhydrobacter aerosaccus]SJZ68356.1 hypothetical protein SAMN02745126_01888 [Enhydrobacter aerosaccus]